VTSVTTLPGHRPRGIDVGDRVLGDPLLLVGGVENRRAVAGADVVALAVLRRRVVHLEEELEQRAEVGLLRVVDDLDGLRVGAVVAIGGVRDVAAAVADARGHDAGLVAEQLLHPPEATAGEDRIFVGHVASLLVVGVSVGVTREQGAVFAITLALKLITMNEAEGRGVHAVAQTSLVPRSVRKQMAQVTVAVLRADLGAGHSMGPVDVLDHVRRFQGLCEARPTGAAVEFIDGRE
jgi:hypothetical protein